MIRLYPTLFLLYLLILAQASKAVEVGAYWAFQLEKQGASPTNATFTENVSVNTWPNGSPSFSYAGSRKWNFGNYGGNQTALDGSLWISGRAFGWNANQGASTGNSFQITLDTSSIENLNVKLRYRLNGIQTTSGQLVQGFSSFEYSVNGGAFAIVPGKSRLI